MVPPPSYITPPFIREKYYPPLFGRPGNFVTPPTVVGGVHTMVSYRLNIWQVKSTGSSPRYASTRNDETFKKRLIVNNRMVKILSDTGAKVSVCGMKQAAEWGLLNRLVPSNVKIHPYKSEPILVRGTVR